MKKRPSQKPNEIWLLSIAVGMVVLNFPFIQVFDTHGFFFGVPTLIVYIFSVWSLLIIGLIAYSRILCQSSNQNKNDRAQGKDQQ
jgi:hypothetical protein